MACPETTAAPPARGRIELLVVGPSLRQWVGGQEVQADLLVRHWADDPEIHAAFVAHNPPAPRALRWTECVPILRTAVRLPVRFLDLWSAVGRAHIVHIFSGAHSSFIVATLPAWCVARLLGRRTLIHYHSGRAREHVCRSRLARSVLRRSDAVVVPSRYLADILAVHGVPSAIVANGAEISGLRYRRRGVIRPHLVCTRNFDAIYGVDLVIRAFARIKRDVPSAHLILAGRGPHDAALRALVKDLGVRDVEFCGGVPPPHRRGARSRRRDGERVACR